MDYKFILWFDPRLHSTLKKFKKLKHFWTNWTSFNQKKFIKKRWFTIANCAICPPKIAHFLNFLQNFVWMSTRESRNENNCILFMLERQMSLIFQVRTSHISNGWNKFWPVHTHTIVSFQLKSTNKGMMLDCCWSLLRFLLLFSYRVLLLKQYS